MGNSICHLNLPNIRAKTTKQCEQKKKTSTVKSKHPMTESLQIYQENQNEYEYLSKLTHFPEHELKLLHSLFYTLDNLIKQDNIISLEELAIALEIPQSSLILNRLFSILDRSQIGLLRFRNFATAMSILDTRGSMEDKIKLSFKIYDLNNDGVIDKDEMIQLLLSTHLLYLDNSNKPIFDNVNLTKCYSEIIDNTWNRFKKHKKVQNDSISFEEYKQYCLSNPQILKYFNFDVGFLLSFEADIRKKRKYTNSIFKRKQLTHGPLVSIKQSPQRLKELCSNLKFKASVVFTNNVERVYPVDLPHDICADIN
ncbi:hypothetical protein RFI_27903 [Reticulomyxa filosa]|uniref:EF-hand domain-containing protein n=1 Tax=Reticulomyxa filosa TaxID=46433 RepID=X6M7P7_RETFI|nr:hypothetical protein RFI_27903 [Reticulomyxa filosa]|eukprot:ETO09472.1 hypothetical protein RFI_27903 [Reticulomyxa filosa]